MRTSGVLCAVVLSCAGTSAADDRVEITAAIGTTPYADRSSIDYHVSTPTLPLVRLTPQTSGPIDVAVSGGVVLRFGAGWYFHPNFALEGRVDIVSLHVDSTPIVYRAEVAVPFSLLNLSQQLSVGPAQISSHRDAVASMNLRTRHALPWRRLSWTAAAGVSYVPGSDFVARVPVSIGPLRLGGLSFLPPIGVPGVEIELRARTPARVGVGLATGVDVSIGSRIALRQEVSYLALQPIRVEWSDVSAPTLLGVGLNMGEPLTTLSPLELRSRFFSVQMGLVFRF